MTTATATWPTPAELQRVTKSIVRAYNALDELTLEVAALADPDDGSEFDDPELRPTFEELGRLTAFIQANDQDLEFMREMFLCRIRAIHDQAASRMAEDGR